MERIQYRVEVPPTQYKPLQHLNLPSIDKDGNIQVPQVESDFKSPSFDAAKKRNLNAQAAARCRHNRKQERAKEREMLELLRLKNLQLEEALTKAAGQCDYYKRRVAQLEKENEQLKR
jgi:hypothetical protein